MVKAIPHQNPNSAHDITVIRVAGKSTTGLMAYKVIYIKGPISIFDHIKLYIFNAICSTPSPCIAL